jgi:hypothetical protein
MPEKSDKAVISGIGHHLAFRARCPHFAASADAPSSALLNPCLGQDGENRPKPMRPGYSDYVAALKIIRRQLLYRTASS